MCRSFEEVAAHGVRITELVSYSYQYSRLLVKKFVYRVRSKHKLGLTFMSRSGEEEPLPLMAPEGSAHVTHNTPGAAQAARAVCVRRAIATAARRPPPHHERPTATGCLISHYNLRAARFLPLLLPRFVLRIIECIPLAPAAMRGERRPDNSQRN